MSNFTITSAQAFQLADDLGLEETDVRTGYSGRGMYGGTCLAFTPDGYDGATESDITFALARLVSMAEVEAMDVSEALDMVADALRSLNPKTDSMGRGVVVYYPGVAVEADENEVEA